MHKDFYASGFLYHPTTAQILLQQLNAIDDSSHSLFRGKFKKTEDAIAGFQKVIFDILLIKLPLTAIFPIYDYMSTELNANHFICYAVVKDSAVNKLKKTKGVKWVSFKQIPKIKLSEQTKQDIIVGQRVINLAQRVQFEKDNPAPEQPIQQT